MKKAKILSKENEILDKICECLISVIKKYLPKLFIYPFVITYGYKNLKYVINNNIEITYSIVFSYFAVIVVLLMIIDFINIYLSYDYRNGNIAKKYCDEAKFDDRTEKIKAYHEAGHFVIAKMLDIPIKEVNIINNGNVGGQLILDMPNILRASQLKSMVMVKYAGFITEKIFIGEASDGCMGCDISDMESANILLRKYVILTDDSISFTGYEEESIKNKCMKLSKLWREEVELLLRKNTDELKEIAEKLIEKKIIKLT